MESFKFSSRRLVLLALSTVLAVGCSNSNGSDVVRKSINVTVQRVEEVDNSLRLRYSGTIEESKTLPASFATSGQVKAVYVSEGDRVSKGQLLAELDDATASNALLMARATYNRAKDAIERLTPMHKNGNLPDIKMVEAETGYEQAKASYAIAKKSYADCKLYAADDGMVGTVSIKAGLGAAPGMAAVTVVQIDKIYANLSVHESEINMIKAGQKALVSVAALGDFDREGVVETVGVVAEPLSHTYNVKVRIDNSDLAILPGMICSVYIETDGGAQGLVVPVQAIVIDESNNPNVYTVDLRSKTAQLHKVTRGGFLKEGVNITSGLEANSLVVVGGQYKLYDNAPVNVLNVDELGSWE